MVNNQTNNFLKLNHSNILISADVFYDIVVATFVVVDTSVDNGVGIIRIRGKQQ